MNPITSVLYCFTALNRMNYNTSPLFSLPLKRKSCFDMNELDFLVFIIFVTQTQGLTFTQKNKTVKQWEDRSQLVLEERGSC